MLHMVGVNGSCPGKSLNEDVHSCLRSTQESLQRLSVRDHTRWAIRRPRQHRTLEAASGDVIQEILMESGLAMYTTQIRPLLSMD